MRKPIIAGNWKLNKISKEAVELVTLLKRDLSDVDKVDIVVCPVFTVLSDVRDAILETNIKLGAQNLFWEDAGAYTGEISGPMLRDVGVEYVIIGHSERRQFFGETDVTVNKRIKAALAHGLTPIVCVGEVLEEREANKTAEVITTQIKGGLQGFSSDEVEKMIIAYEPVWAIGTGKTATPEQAQEIHKLIRDLIKNMHSEEVAQGLRIQYGGSVKPDNIAELISQPDIDGALVGGASLKSEQFVELVRKSIS